MALAVSAGAEVEDEFLPVSSVGIAPPRDKTSAQASFLLFLKVGDVELPEGMSTELSESLSGLRDEEAMYVVAQFYEAVTASLRDALDVLDVTLLEYLPNRAFLVAIPAGAVTELSSLPEVRAVAALEPEWKISPQLAEEMDNLPGSTYAVWIESFEPIADDYSGVSAMEDRLSEGRLSAAEITQLSEDVRVKWIQLRPVERLSLAESVPLVGADDAWSRGDVGTGVSVAVIDSGIDSDHTHFSGVPVTSSWDWVDSDWNPEDGDGHGTHCSGIVTGGSSPGGNTISGTAPGVTLVIERVFDNTGGWHGGSYEDIFDYAVDDGATILSNSWGHDSDGEYDSGARAVDEYA